tara:strand:- start:1274 stop:1573 length:300 start_codon:yes stop_codon:yes gene_type:complete
MPLYEFECKKCTVQYDEFVSYDETGKYPTVKCPECGSKRKLKLISQIARGANKDSHGYKFGHKLEEAQSLRRRAKKAQGDSGYNKIDDISGGKHFGEVK